MWLGAVVLLIGGLCWWWSSAPQMVTLTITLIDSTTNLPCPNEVISMQRARFNLPPVFPNWVHQLRLEQTLKVTDAQGRVRFECPSLQEFKARSRYQISYLPRSPALISVRQDFSLLQSDQVTIYVEPRLPAAGLPPRAGKRIR